MSQFIYLLNAFEAASQHNTPAEVGYGEKRKALLEYVEKLESARPEALRSEVAPPAGENAPGELEQVYKDLMNGTLVLVRNWFTKEPYCAQAEQKASQAICRAICAPSPRGA